LLQRPGALRRQCASTAIKRRAACKGTANPRPQRRLRLSAQSGGQRPGFYLILDATSGATCLRPARRAASSGIAHQADDDLSHLLALDSAGCLGDALPVSINALNAPPTKMGMTPGTVSVRDATMALVTRSTSDAAIALAETLGGDGANFAARARRPPTRHVVVGVPQCLRPAQSRVSHDVADMARFAYALMRDFSALLRGLLGASYPCRGRILENHNRMLGSYEGHGKNTAASGFNSMSAMRDNRAIGVDGRRQRRQRAALADLMIRFRQAQAMRLS
jgi:hypothetical protein